jgi:hypothetical protein
MQNFELRSLQSPSKFKTPFKAVHLLRLAIAQCVTAGFVAAALPAAALTTYDNTYRSTSGDYQTCVAQITGAGIAGVEASTACAAALSPQDLSKCVVGIDSRTALTATDALSNCRQVRRPVELSTCVVDINAIDNPTDAAPLLNVMDHCRRSLLPVRFSACVVGLRKQANFATTDALTDCIAATNRPRDVLPNFLPGSSASNQPPTAQPDQTQPDQTQPSTPESMPESTPQQMQQPAPEQMQQSMPGQPEPSKK